MATTKTEHVNLSLSKGLTIGLITVAGIGFLSGGFTLGVLAGHGFSANSATATAPTTTTTTGTGTGTTGTSKSTGTTTSSPFTVGTAFPFKTAVETLSGHQTTLAQGPKGTIVMAMASWCLYCGYEDKWVLPQLAKTSGVAIDIVDTSPQGGIANSGPQNPAFSGHDGTGGPLTVAGMESVMTQYKKTYGTLNAANVHLYVAPQTTQSAWNIQSFPTLGFIGSNGKVVVAPAGAQSLSQAQSDLHQALGG